MVCEIQPINGITQDSSDTEVRIQLLKKRACIPLLDVEGYTPSAVRIRNEVIEARKKNLYLNLLQSADAPHDVLEYLLFIRTGLSLYHDKVDLSNIVTHEEMDLILEDARQNTFEQPSSAQGFPKAKINLVFNTLSADNLGDTSQTKEWLGLSDGMPQIYGEDDTEIPPYVQQFAYTIDAQAKPLETMAGYWFSNSRSEAETTLQLRRKMLTQRLQDAKDAFGVNTIEKAYLQIIEEGEIPPHSESDNPQIIVISKRQMDILTLLVTEGLSTDEISERTGFSPDQVRSSIALISAKMAIPESARDHRYRVFQRYMKDDYRFVTRPSEEPIKYNRIEPKIVPGGTVIITPLEAPKYINPQIVRLFQHIADNPKTDLHKIDFEGLSASQIADRLLRWRNKMNANSNEQLLLAFWQMGLISIPRDINKTNAPSHRPEENRLERLLIAFLSTGASKKELADMIGVKPLVEEHYMSELLKAWHVGRRRELLVEAIKRGRLVLQT